MAVSRINFTKQSLEKLTPPPKDGGQVYDTYYDLKTKGLVLLVSYGGSKTFYLYRKINGRPERIKLGGFPDLSVEMARNKAAQHNGQIASGRNPQDDKRSLRMEMTLEELFDIYMERYSKKHKRSWKYDEREIPKFLKHWFKRKISGISRADVQALHAKIGAENGMYQANRLLERLRGMYNRAIEWGWEGTNPALGIKKFREITRDRFLQPNEFPYFMQSLMAETNRTLHDYIMVSLFTGARRSNVLAMRWEQLDLERAQWRVPDTKNGEPVVIALVPEAAEILQQRRRLTNGPWVFPNTDSASGHFEDPKRGWRRILRRGELYQLLHLLREQCKWNDPQIELMKAQGEADLESKLAELHKKAESLKIDTSEFGFPSLRLHDLRRTLGSWQAITGASLQVIGKSLGHKSQQSTAIYARLHLDPVRESIEKATTAMLAAAAKSIA